MLKYLVLLCVSGCCFISSADDRVNDTETRIQEISDRIDAVETRMDSLHLKLDRIDKSLSEIKAGVDRLSGVSSRQVSVASVAPRSSVEASAEAHLRSVHGISVSGMSLQQMEEVHDRAHGGDSYHFPGMASLNPARVVSQTVRYQQVSNCPGGVCPMSRTFSRVRYRRR